MKTVSRKAWGARAAKRGVQSIKETERTEFIVHHSGGPASQSVRSIQDHCMDARGFLDIDYNFLVSQDGKIYTGRGWGKVGSHAVGHNETAVGVCVIGNDQLNIEAMHALQELYAEACKRAGKSLRPRVHSDVDATKCPGDKIRAWVRAGHLAGHLDDKQTKAPRLLRLTSPWMRGADVEAVQEKLGVYVDGIFGPVTAAAVERWQRSHHLVVDGIVGPKTRASMGI